MRMSKPCLIAVFAAVMAMGVCASDPDGLPYWFEYGGAITPPEANAAGENACEFKSPDGKELCRLGLSLISTRKTVLTFSRDGGKTWDATVAAPVGMTGYNPAAKSLGDGRVMIAYADPTKCDSKVYRHRACAWIGPWASLRAGSGRGFYRVLYTCGKEGEVGFPEVAETDAQFAKFAAASKDANGFGARPLWVDLTKDGKIRDHNQPLNPARYSVVCASDKYDAHPTTVMLPDEKTIFCFWDLAHGGPLGPAAKSTDAGRTWTRIDDQIPEQLKKLHDAPVAFRFIDPKSGKARIRVFAGYEHIDDKNWRGEKDRLLLEAMPSIISGDDGKTWTYAEPMGPDFRCVISFFGMQLLKDGSYLGLYHRGSQANGDGHPLEVLSTVSRDGGLTWEKPVVVAHDDRYDLCEPAVFYSPDQSELCMLIRENRGKGPSQMCFSKDEGKAWSKIENAPLALNGHRHVVQLLPDGRVLVVFRLVDWGSPHVYGWVGPYSGIRDGSGKGGYLIKLFHNYGSPFDCGYQGVHLRKDGEIVITTYVKFRPYANATPSIVSMRFRIEEADALFAREVAGIADDAKAIAEAKSGATPSADVLSATKTAQTDWTPFAGTGLKVLPKARVYGPVDKGKIGTPPCLQRKDVEEKAGQKFKVFERPDGVADLCDILGLKLDPKPWFDPPLAAYVVYQVESAAAKTVPLRMMNDYYGTVYVNGERVASQVRGNILGGSAVNAKLRKGKNEIILVTSPGSVGQWVCAAAVADDGVSAVQSSAVGLGPNE